MKKFIPSSRNCWSVRTNRKLSRNREPEGRSGDVLRKMKQMDERKFDDLVTDFYVAFNHTAAEPGLVEAVKNHELPFERPSKTKTGDIEETFEIER